MSTSVNTSMTTAITWAHARDIASVGVGEHALFVKTGRGVYSNTGLRKIRCDEFKNKALKATMKEMYKFAPSVRDPFILQ